MKKNLAITLLILLTLLFVGGNTYAAAYRGPMNGQPSDVFSEIAGQLDTAGAETTLQKTDPRAIIGGIIKAVLGILGTILVVLILYSGFLWMTAGGNEEQVGKAKKLIGNAVVGLVIILAAYTITLFVTTNIVNSTIVE